MADIRTFEVGDSWELREYVEANYSDDPQVKYLQKLVDAAIWFYYDVVGDGRIALIPDALADVKSFYDKLLKAMGVKDDGYVVLSRLIAR